MLGLDSKLAQKSLSTVRTTALLQYLFVLFQPLRNPVMTVSCYHNFCSMCVRKYLLYKQQCPACFIPLHDPDLKPNRGLANAMEIIAR